MRDGVIAMVQWTMTTVDYWTIVYLDYSIMDYWTMVYWTIA